MPEAEKPKLLAERKKKKAAGQVKRTSRRNKRWKASADDKTDASEDLVRFVATFGGVIREPILADTCVDANLMDSETLARIEEKGSVEKVEKVEKMVHPRVNDGGRATKWEAGQNYLHTRGSYSHIAQDPSCDLTYITEPSLGYHRPTRW